MRLDLVNTSKIVEHICSKNQKFKYEEAKINRGKRIQTKITPYRKKLTNNPISQLSIEIKPYNFN